MNGTSAHTIGSGGKQTRIKLTPKEQERVAAMIKNAKSLQEIARLEKEINEGRIPKGAADDDAMEM
jgi:U2 small nuclear ribonucleoprotein A'